MRPTIAVAQCASCYPRQVFVGGALPLPNLLLPRPLQEATASLLPAGRGVQLLRDEPLNHSAASSRCSGELDLVISTLITERRPDSPKSPRHRYARIDVFRYALESYANLSTVRRAFLYVELDEARASLSEGCNHGLVERRMLLKVEHLQMRAHGGGCHQCAPGKVQGPAQMESAHLSVAALQYPLQCGLLDCGTGDVQACHVR